MFDEQKTHQHPRRAEKPANLRSETPQGVLQEIYALSLAHYAMRKVMHEAAVQADLDPDNLSFLGCLHILRMRMPECVGMTPAELAEWYQAVLWELSNERTEPRRNRINPRVIKQKMSKFRKKRPEHRPVPPLTKTFEESILMGQMSVKGSHRLCRAVTRCQSKVVTRGTASLGSDTGWS